MNLKAAKMSYTSIVIPVFTYCGTVNLNLLRTSLAKLDRIHERAVGIITKTNPVKLKPITNYKKRHACHIVRTSISNYYHTQSQQETRNSQ